MLCSNPSEPRKRSHALRASVPALVLVLAATGCVRPKPPGLKVADLESSIVFGLKPIAVATPLGAPQAPPLPVSNEAPPLPSDPEIPVVPAPPPPPVRTAPEAKKHFCRTATINDFPTNATLGAPTPPKPGFYRYKKSPPELFGTDHYPVTPADLQTRLIANVTPPVATPNQVNSAPPPAGSGQPVVTTTYQYDQVTYLDNTGKNFLVDRIRVTDNPISQSAAVTVLGGGLGPTTYAGGPDRGVALYGRQVVQNGGTATFLPSSPLLLLPLPAVSGQTWQSVSTDPASGATYILYGQTIRRARVDACGDVVEGWAVQAQTVFKDPRQPAAQNANFTYFVNTLNGGQIIYEKVAPIGSPELKTATPADGATPAPPEPPANPGGAGASEFSLATRDPQPVP